jgi:hypothetical protein
MTDNFATPALICFLSDRFVQDVPEMHDKNFLTTSYWLQKKIFKKFYVKKEK